MKANLSKHSLKFPTMSDIKNNQSFRDTKCSERRIHKCVSFSPRKRQGYVLLYPKAEEAKGLQM